MCGGGCSAAAWCQLTQRTAACNGSALYEIWGCRFINIYVLLPSGGCSSLMNQKEEKPNIKQLWTTDPVRVTRINIQIDVHFDASATEESYFWCKLKHILLEPLRVFCFTLLDKITKVDWCFARNRRGSETCLLSRNSSTPFDNHANTDPHAVPLKPHKRGGSFDVNWRSILSFHENTSARRVSGEARYKICIF